MIERVIIRKRGKGKGYMRRQPGEFEHLFNVAGDAIPGLAYLKRIRPEVSFNRVLPSTGIPGNVFAESLMLNTFHPWYWSGFALL